MSMQQVNRLLIGLVAVGIVAVTVGAASLSQPQGGDRSGGRGSGEGASVQGSMKTINRAMRQLRGQIEDISKKEECLRLVGDMQQGCLAAKRQPVPGDLLKNAKDDAAKNALRDEYRHELIELMRALLLLEEDVAAGKTDSAKSRMAELVKLRDHAHEELGVDDEDEATKGK
jgi:Spy/CpxP family protein refolding chaperone